MDQKSTVGMMEQPALEEIETRIDAIIKKALLIISNKPGSDPHIIYNDVGLLDLVIKPIRVLCFEKIDPNTATLFDSNVGALGRCTWIDERHAKVYLCTDCASDASNTICEECFMNSIHVQHNYIEVVRKVQWLCNCGNTEAYENSIPCCKHEIPDNTRNLPAYLFKRIRSVVRHLFRYLELLCGEESELDEHVENILLMDENLSRINLKDKPPMVKSGLENRGEASNAFKSCVVIFKPEDEDPTNVYSCVSFANPPGNMIDLLLNIQSCGYLCVKYRDTPQNCQAATFSIEEYIQNHLPGSGIYCRIIKVHRFFFMKLSRALIVILNSLCLSKSLICDHMSEMVFKETSLPEKFFFNRGLWVDIREFITNFIFLSTLFSRKRGLNLVKFYWKNFDRLFTELLMGSNIKAYLFRISMQIVTSKKQFKYLVINEFGTEKWPINI
ncbi:E3 ubiquitin-protein ligase UBR1 [Thelohanellus kitauei]|uniref:E3 ubiquitin-protein ligase n=1 Tax=Thelohanellus kitauei TaxID=669202 RepID=A0A0C2N4C7_THEKT|nr:E3 ubiquitin-protein ligase UBR1 [Thelohanellus kitauei]